MAPIRARLLIFASVLIFAALAALPARAENYARIVSLYPGHTDNVVALGAGAKLVGISENDNEGLLPGVPRFSMKAGPEALLALRPDLVLTRTLADSQNVGGLRAISAEDSGARGNFARRSGRGACEGARRNPRRGGEILARAQAARLRRSYVARASHLLARLVGRASRGACGRSQRRGGGEAPAQRQLDRAVGS